MRARTVLGDDGCGKTKRGEVQREATTADGGGSGAANDGAITFVTENFQYHRPQLLTDRKLAEW